MSYFIQMAYKYDTFTFSFIYTVLKKNFCCQLWCITICSLLFHPVCKATNLLYGLAAAHLLIALIPSNNFRQSFRSSRNLVSPHKEAILVCN